MPKQFNEYKTQAQKLFTEADRVEGEMEKYLNNRQKQWGVVEGGVDSVKDRVKELKGTGVQAATAHDYAKQDPETLTLLKGVVGHFKSIIESGNKFNAEYKKFVEVRKDVDALFTDMSKEVADREKKKAGVISIDSKSLPDMKKLLKDVETRKKALRDTSAQWAPMDENKMKKQLDDLLKAAVA